MITKFYKATSGYFDLTPGQSQFEFSVKTTDNGKLVMTPKNKFVPEFNEIQIDGDVQLRKDFLPSVVDQSKILFLDNPDYEALKLRRSAMATKDIPLKHSDCFVARWMCLSNLTADTIEKGVAPPVGCYATASGNWGGLRELKAKKAMLPYIKQLDAGTLKQLESATSSATFARKFIEWRDTLNGRITYQPVEDGE